jgi:hypothetical protein
VATCKAKAAPPGNPEPIPTGREGKTGLPPEWIEAKTTPEFQTPQLRAVATCGALTRAECQSYDEARKKCPANCKAWATSAVEEASKAQKFIHPHFQAKRTCGALTRDNCQYYEAQRKCPGTCKERRASPGTSEPSKSDTTPAPTGNKGKATTK